MFILNDDIIKYRIHASRNEIPKFDLCDILANPILSTAEWAKEVPLYSGYTTRQIARDQFNSLLNHLKTTTLKAKAAEPWLKCSDQ